MMDETIFISLDCFELDYTLENNYNNKIDWSALHYDDWNTFEYWTSKWPSGLLEQFPELNSIVETIFETKKGITPLMELENRKNK